jgi:hypothetical protein
LLSRFYPFPRATLLSLQHATDLLRRWHFHCLQSCWNRHFIHQKDDKRVREGQLHLESCRFDYDCAYRVLPGGNYVAALLCGPSFNPWSRSAMLKEVELACLLITKSEKPSSGDVEKRIVELHSIIDSILYGAGNLALACAASDPQNHSLLAQPHQDVSQWPTKRRCKCLGCQPSAPTGNI